MEYLWATGEGRALASDTVAALQDTEPHLKGHLQVTWRLLKTWRINEVPNRAPPLPAQALNAMFALVFVAPALCLWPFSPFLGFYGLLRTGKLLAICNRHIFMPCAASGEKVRNRH